MNILSNIDQIANLIIRPSRYTYKSTDLGNKTFKIQQKLVIRDDFEIKNQNNLKIKGSIYSASQPITNSQQILIYLHCNSGCRIQGLAYMKMAIQQNFTYIVFDFTGSGVSQGKFVSLGYYQTLDLQCIYKYIREKISPTAKIIIWGRSMGAVTALNFLLKGKYQISLAIFDSPFKSLRDLFIQIGKQKTNFPDFILDIAYKYLKPIIQQKAKFNIQQIDLMIQNNPIHNPGLFIASKNDSLVPFQQIQQIFENYKGLKQMILIQQGHNQPRNQKVIQELFVTIRKYLNQQQIIKKHKKNYIKYLPERKQFSRKKLQLTIKSLSQRQLISGKTFRDNKQQVTNQQQINKNFISNINNLKSNNSFCNNNNNYNKNQYQYQPYPTSQQRQSVKILLDKKQTSCLLPHKKSLKQFQVQQQQQNKTININKSQSKLKIKRKPFQIKNFFEQKQKQTNLSPTPPFKNYQFQQKQLQSKTIKYQNNLNSCDSQISQPNSDIKNENSHINKINFNLNIIGQKQQQFLKRCQSLQKVQHQSIKLIKNLSNINKQTNIRPNIKNKINIIHNTIPINLNLNKIQENNKNYIKLYQKTNENNNIISTSSNTYREIKCTQRVLEKIIQKQQKKQLNLNTKKMPSSQSSIPLQNIQNYHLNIKKQPLNNNLNNSNLINNNQNRPPEQRSSKQRKTLQHIVNKKPPFVELKGVKNYRSSFQSSQSKFKSQLRK